MKTVRIIFEKREDGGSIVLNNTYVVRGRSVAVDWWTGVDIIVDVMGRGRTTLAIDDVATGEVVVCPLGFYRVLAVRDGLHVVQILPARDIPNENLPVVHSSEHTLDGIKTTVEVAERVRMDVNPSGVERRVGAEHFVGVTAGDVRRAFALGDLGDEVTSDVRHGRVRIVGGRGSVEYCPVRRAVINERRKLFDVGTPAQMFMQCVMMRDFRGATDYLTFGIVESAMWKFFGEFEIIRENYSGDERAVSVIRDGRVVTYTFDIAAGKITNINA